MAEIGTIKFGTSGFRGIIGDNWTKANVHKIGLAFKQMLKDSTKNVGRDFNIIIGYDNRFMGRESAHWFSEAVSCDFIKITMFSMSVPTPVIAFKAVQDYDFGIMFTASHNPYIYNGIKVMLKGGKEADDEFFSRLSKYLNVKPQFSETNIKYTDDTNDYINKVISFLDTDRIEKSGVKILFNAMHGSGAAVTNAILEKLKIKYDIMNENPDACFGGMVPAPYEYNLKPQSKRVIKEKFNFGFALDGDGDRVAFIDTDGKFYDCNYLLAVFYYYFVEYKKRTGGVVKNFLSSNLAAKLAKKYGYDIHETRVGFKFLGAKLQETDALMAGESTGIAFKDISLVKDGIFAAFLLIDAMVQMKKSIGKIVEEILDLVAFPTHYMEFAYEYNEVNRGSVEKKILHENSDVKFDTAEWQYEVKKTERLPDGVKFHFADDYWCAARMSGTEPVVRFYTEMQSEKEAQAMIKRLEQIYDLRQRQT